MALPVIPGADRSRWDAPAQIQLQNCPNTDCFLYFPAQHEPPLPINLEPSTLPVPGGASTLPARDGRGRSRTLPAGTRRELALMNREILISYT